MSSWLTTIPRAAWIFAALALVFGVLVLRDRLRTKGEPSPKRRAWTRLAVIFAAVTIMLIAMRL